MMPSVPSVFVSATSRDLGSYRKEVADALLGLDVHAVIQDHFPPDYRSVREMLEDKITKCDAMICLIGRRYGAGPANRTADEPRRSYTQLEYEIGDKLGRPLFVYVATDECPLDHPDDEPEDDEVRGLQLEHIKRIRASNRVRMPFRSRDDLAFQVRGMRFDEKSLKQGVATRLAVILDAELLDVSGARARLGEQGWVHQVLEPYHKLLKETLVPRGGVIGTQSATESEVNFETADAAVDSALDLHEAFRSRPWPKPAGAPGLRIGIHVGQVVQFVGSDETRALSASHAPEICRRLTSLALPGQTLLTRTAFDIAREHVRRMSLSSSDASVSALRWCAHGRYKPTSAAPGDDEAIEVYEVGEEGRAPLSPPPESAQFRRADSQEEREMEGWRPAVGQEIPRQPGWVIERKLGEGGFGEVWVAFNARMRDRRVFKFCFDASRLSSFKRELSLFKLLRDALGDRPDIARLLEVRLDQAPFYLESEFVPGGNLHDWAIEDARLSSLPLEERLRLLSETARATAAAHSVGVIHKDLKPSNVFMRKDTHGRWHPILADFGIGAVADRSVLERRGITFAGWTQSLLEPGSSRTGTRMYQPPESTAGSAATMQADVYALGVLLFQVLVGDFDIPFGEGWEDELAAAWRGMGLDPLVDRRFRLLTGDIRVCVVKDPSRRLGTAAQVVERIETLEARVAADASEDARRAAEREAEEAKERVERARVRVRRLRGALAGALAVLALIACLGVYAFMEKKAADTARGVALANEKKAQAAAFEALFQKKEADTARGVALANEKKAEANAGAARAQSRLALATLNAMIFDIQRSVKNLPGGSEVRRRLLTTALARLEHLSGEFIEKSSVDLHAAASLSELGDLVLQFGDASLAGTTGTPRRPGAKAAAGAVASSMRLYTRASEIAEALIKADPKNALARRDLSLSHKKLGDVQLRLGATDRALEMYRKSLNLDDATVRANPNNAEARRDLSGSYDKLGDIHLRLGATDKALEMYRKGLELREIEVSAAPNNAQARRDLSVSYDKLGDVHLRLNATDKALEMYRKGLELDEAAVEADPNNALARLDLSGSYHRLGDVHLRLGAAANALEMYRKGLELSEAAVTADPDNTDARRNLAVSYHKLGDVHLRLGATDKALEMCQKKLRLDETAVQTDPNDTQAQRDLSISYNDLGDVHLRLGATDKALQMYQKALEMMKAAVKTDPGNADARRDLSLSYDRLGDVHLRLGATDKSLQMYQKGLELMEAAVEADPKDTQARRDLAMTHRDIGFAFGLARDFKRARISYERALVLDQEIVKRIPQEPEIRRDLARDYDGLCRIHATTGAWAAAVEAASQAVAHAREAHRTEGGGGADPWDYSHSLQMLGLGQEAVGRLRDAVKSFEQAIAADPKRPLTHNDLAWLLSTGWDDDVRDGKRAIELATKACELTRWEESICIRTLAAAYAEAGKFEDAVKWQKKALETPKAFGEELEQVKARLALYESGKPFHQPKPEQTPKPNNDQP